MHEKADHVERDEVEHDRGDHFEHTTPAAEKLGDRRPERARQHPGDEYCWNQHHAGNGRGNQTQRGGRGGTRE